MLNNVYCKKRLAWLIPVNMIACSLVIFALSDLVVANVTAKQPNVVLVMTDDQDYGDLHCHGNPILKTPNLDKLHGMSVRLTNFHVSPTCSPTRAALLTGRYTNATGAWHTIAGRSLMHRQEKTLGDCFKANGYVTGIFGKWHLGDNYPLRPQDRGFDEVLIHGGGGITQTPDYFGNDYFDDTYFHNGKAEKHTGFCTDVWFDNAIKFMKKNQVKGQPFFCYIPTNAAHSPMFAPEKYKAMYSNDPRVPSVGFYGMISNIDDNMGRLMAFLKQSGLEENTIFIFMTDNGSAIGKRGNKGYNAGMRERKGSPYEGGHRVPYFIRWPGGKIDQPRDIDTLTAHVDLLPTLMDLLNLKRPDGLKLHGQSIKPLLFGQKVDWADRVIITDSQRGEKLVRWKRASVMSQNWRLVNASSSGKPDRLELYDIGQDPGQKKNIINKHPNVAKRLVEAYVKWWFDIATERADEFVRMVIGNDRENPMQLTCHDWHMTSKRMPPWNQQSVRQAIAVNGWWAIDVDKTGRYRFELRRWAREVNLPINAPINGKPKGKAIHATKARLVVGKIDQTIAVKSTGHAAVFEVKLKQGPTRLQTWFIDDNGKSRGAYYVVVKRLGD